MSGESVAEFLVLGSQPVGLVAVGPQLLAERVGGGPLGGGQRSRAAGGGVGLLEASPVVRVKRPRVSDRSSTTGLTETELIALLAPPTPTAHGRPH